MNKFKLFFLLSFSFMCVFLSGQSKSKEAAIKWSAEQKESRRSSLSGIIGKNANGIYALKLERKMLSLNGKFTIEHYDHNMKLKKSADFDLKEGKKQKYYEGNFLSDNGKLYIFSSFRNKAKQKN